MTECNPPENATSASSSSASQPPTASSSSAGSAPSPAPIAGGPPAGVPTPAPSPAPSSPLASAPAPAPSSARSVDQPLRLGVLVGGSGRTLVNFADAIAAGRLNATINVVIGSRPGLVGLQRATERKLMNFVVDRRDSKEDAAHSKQVFSLLDDAGVDLVVLAGWLCLLVAPPKYAGKVMNIHPALLPSFGGKGMFGAKVHQAVLDHGCKVSGCSVHFVDSTYDTGPIILQRCCAVEESDTAETLGHRVFAEETLAYPAAVALFAANRLKIVGRRVVVGG